MYKAPLFAAAMCCTFPALAADDLVRPEARPEANTMHVELAFSDANSERVEVLRFDTVGTADQHLELPTIRLPDGTICRNYIAELKTVDGVPTTRIGTICNVPAKP